MRHIAGKINTNIFVFLLLVTLMFVITGCGKNNKKMSDEGTNTSNSATTENGETDMADDENMTEEQNTQNMQADNEKSETNGKDRNEAKIYVAIGDSLTYGFGLADRKKDSFPSRLTEMLDADGENYIEYNYGISGLTTEGLLDMLKRDEIGMIEDADLITIDIGANDILHAMDTFVYAAMATGNISAEEATAVETGYQNSLTTEYENTDKILSIIRDKNPDCEIVFLNIYNPYRYIDLALVIGEETVDLPEYTDGLMKGLNSNISKLAEAYNCKLADCYTAFAMTPLDVLNAKYTDNEQNLDIHPNKDGYTLMATVVYETMKK